LAETSLKDPADGVLIRAARAVGFDLSPAEAALLSAIDSQAEFSGLRFRSGTEGRDLFEEFRQWLPSVWRVTPDVEQSDVEEDDVSEEQEVLDGHERLYRDAPFPVVAGRLLGWLLTTGFRKRQGEIQIDTVKVSGSIEAPGCDLDCALYWHDCVIESHCYIDGAVRGSIALSGLYAQTLTLSGEYSRGINLNDVQVTSHGGRGFWSGLRIDGVRTPYLDIYGMRVRSAGIRESAISRLGVRGRIYGETLRLIGGEFGTVAISATAEPSSPSFDTDSVKISRDCHAGGIREVRITDSTIGGDLTIRDLAETLSLSNVEVKGTLSVDLGTAAREVDIRYDHVQVRKYEDRLADLAAVRQIELDGLHYGELTQWDDEVSNRKRWLMAQPQVPFPLSSWRQMAAQLRRRGRFEGAREILIQAETARRASLSSGTMSRAWSWIVRNTTGYGWELWRIGLCAVLLVLSGSVVAQFAWDHGILVAKSPVSSRVEFNPVVYALDLALPIIKLDHAALWVPSGRGWDGALVQIYFWLHTLAGWVVATLFVIGFTSLARHAQEASQT
jgi:hypothetical protein